MLSHNQQAFLALVRAGLWEKDVQLKPFGKINYNEVYRLAQEQAVTGLVAAGLEHVVDAKVPQDVALAFVGDALQLEHNNTAMNYFMGGIVKRMCNEGIYAVLVKGQGIAQCYERPLWRLPGDIDFLLTEKNYRKAKDFLFPLASSVEVELPKALHLGMVIDKWDVELHGTLRSCCLDCMDKVIDKVQNAVFCDGLVRTWMNGNTNIFLPRADEDVFFVFTHILKHFYHGGIGLRQVCDWVRLLWTCKSQIDVDLLYNRLRDAGILSEWKAFASLSVLILGMQGEKMPLYNSNKQDERKVMRILDLIFETGNFGHSRDSIYSHDKSFIKRKLIAFSSLT